MSIQVNNISYIYSEGLPGESKALDDISFEVGDGEFLGIIGHTGSGKSTLLQQLNGLLKPKSGTIIVDGTDITDKSASMLEVRRHVGLVFQYPEYQLFEETVAKDVAFGPTNLGLEEEEKENRVREAIELVGLDYEEVKDKSPFDLSGGQKRRIAIAGVIAMKPRVLILDEPTAGLDPHAHADILHMIKTIHKAEENIIILVSHNMNDIAENADRVLVIDKGRAVMFGTPLEVFSRKEELSGMGLSIPDAMRITSELRERGLKIREDVLSVNEAAEAIYEAIEGKKE